MLAGYIAGRSKMNSVKLMNLFNIFLRYPCVYIYICRFLIFNVDVILYIRLQWNIENPVKHLRWSFLRKQLTAFRS